MIGMYVAGILMVAWAIVMGRPTKTPVVESPAFRQHADEAIDLTGGQR